MFKTLSRRTRLRKPSHRPVTKPLILVGVRQNIADIKVLAKKCGYTVLGVLDQYYWGNTESIDGVPVIGSELWLKDQTNQLAMQWKQTAWFFCSSWWTGKQFINTLGLDEEQLRQQRIELLDTIDVKVANLVDPDAWIPNPNSVKFGKGIMILGRAMIGTYVEIGNHSVIDWDASISKYSIVKNNVIVGARATLANCIVEDNVRVGACAVVVGTKKNLKPAIIGNNSIVHTGAVVVDDVPPEYVRTFTNRTMPRIQPCDE